MLKKARNLTLEHIPKYKDTQYRSKTEAKVHSAMSRPVFIVFTIVFLSSRSFDPY